MRFTQRRYAPDSPYLQHAESKKVKWTPTPADLRLHIVLGPQGGPRVEWGFSHPPALLLQRRAGEHDVPQEVILE